MMKPLLVCALFILCCQFSSAQSPFSKNSLKFTFGYGNSSANTYIYGRGPSISLGFQRNIYKERLRFNSNIGLGMYDNGEIWDSPQMSYKSISLNTILSYDIIKYKTFSMFLGGGPVLNYYNGNIEHCVCYGFDGGIKINDLHYGGNINAGFRINPLKKRFAFEFLPVNLNLGSNGFGELNVRFGFDYKLK